MGTPFEVPNMLVEAFIQAHRASHVRLTGHVFWMRYMLEAAFGTAGSVAKDNICEAEI
jgi:hypothetical protein